MNPDEQDAVGVNRRSYAVGALGVVLGIATATIAPGSEGDTPELPSSELIDSGTRSYDATAGMCAVDLLVDVAPSERVVVQNEVAGDSDRTVENTGERAFATIVPIDSEVLVYAVDLDAGTSTVLERFHVDGDCSLSEVENGPE